MRTTSIQIEKTLQEMLDGRIDLIQGCRILVRFGRDLESIAGTEYLTIVAIESETDDLPVGEERTGWAKAALERKDREREAYLQRVEVRLRAACETILRRVTRL